MTSAIIIIFNIVPRPGNCFIGNHKSNINKLMAAVEMRNYQEKWLDIPCARTVQRLTPKLAATNNASLKPNSV